MLKMYLTINYIQLFEKYFENVAMISIAHKVTTIMNSDKIMVLNDGRVSEFDHP